MHRESVGLLLLALVDGEGDDGRDDDDDEESEQYDTDDGPSAHRRVLMG